jgi:transposase-like protein
MNKRKQYTAAFKAQVVLELLREEKTLGQVAAEHEVHPQQLRRWKQLVLERLPELFAVEGQPQAAPAEQERRCEQLYAQIGRLTTQLAWLKKKAGVDNVPL